MHRIACHEIMRSILHHLHTAYMLPPIIVAGSGQFEKRIYGYSTHRDTDPNAYENQRLVAHLLRRVNS